LIRRRLSKVEIGPAIAIEMLFLKLFPEVSMHSVAWWPTLLVLVIASITDLRSYRIPNWLSLPFLACGIVVSSGLHGFRGFGQSIGGIGLAVVLIGVFCWLGGMGMGDLKLGAAIGAWIGPSQFFGLIFL